MEMYRAPHGADDFGTGVPGSRATFSMHRFGPAGCRNTLQALCLEGGGPKTSRILIMSR